ncbi:hypothetical protein B0H13DRAFT_1871184 [Mycena leptocephala]|nr:hypothetical protein B0H13DRAFT_1871184 [Mycena leptocephala]
MESGAATHAASIDRRLISIMSRPKHPKRKQDECQRYEESEQDYPVVTTRAEVITHARVNINLAEGWEYRVKWAGYDSDEDSWEPTKNVEACQALLRRFWNEIGQGLVWFDFSFLHNMEELERRVFKKDFPPPKKYTREQKHRPEESGRETVTQIMEPLFLPSSDVSDDEFPIDNDDGQNNQSAFSFILDDNTMPLWQDALLSYLDMPTHQLKSAEGEICALLHAMITNSDISGLSLWITSEVEVAMGTEDGEVVTEMKNKGQMLRILARRSGGKVAAMVKRLQSIWGNIVLGGTAAWLYRALALLHPGRGPELADDHATCELGKMKRAAGSSQCSVASVGVRPSV